MLALEHGHLFAGLGAVFLVDGNRVAGDDGDLLADVDLDRLLVALLFAHLCRVHRLEGGDDLTGDSVAVAATPVMLIAPDSTYLNPSPQARTAGRTVADPADEE